MNGSLPPIRLVPGWLLDWAHWRGDHGLLQSLQEHVLYSLIAVAIAALIAIPLGLFIGHTGRGVFLATASSNALRAVPAFGLLILLYITITPRIGYHGSLGWLAPQGSVPSLVPVEIMLIVLSIPAILSNTYAGVQAIERSVVDAAKGMGLTHWQIVRQVDFPVALPLILSGIRSATLQTIATATIAGYLPFLGGLGYQIFVNGLPQITDPNVGYPAMLGASVVVALLAFSAELVLHGIGRVAISPGLRHSARKDGG